MEGDEGCNVRSFCADGDGILQVVEYANNVYCLEDQCERVKYWHDIDTAEKLKEVLENAQNYLAATYHAIYDDAKHWEDEPTTDEKRLEINATMGYKHLG